MVCVNESDSSGFLLLCSFSVKTCCGSLNPGRAHEFSLSLVKIQAHTVINHMCSSGSTCSSYVNASVREEFPSVPYSARHLNDDKCATRSGNIESYQDIYQATFEQYER